MRISTFAITVAVAAGSLMAMPALINSAYAVQDQPVTIGGVESVCTGVGSAKDNPAWKNYPIKLTFSNLAGENEAAEHVAITQGGKSVMETDCDAPWLLIKAPGGKYDVHASLPDSRTASASFSTSGSGAQQAINLAFPGGKQTARTPCRLGNQSRCASEPAVNNFQRHEWKKAGAFPHRPAQNSYPPWPLDPAIGAARRW